MSDLFGRPLPITDLGPNEAAAITVFEAYIMAGSTDMSEVCGRMLRVRMVEQLWAFELYGKHGLLRRTATSGPGRRGAPSITVEFFKPQTTYLGAALGRSPQLASSDDSMPLIEPLDVQHLTHP